MVTLNKSKEEKKLFVSFLEIVLMVLSVVAFSYFISKDNLVSADETSQVERNFCIQIPNGKSWWKVDNRRLNLICYKDCIDSRGDNTGRKLTVDQFCGSWIKGNSQWNSVCEKLDTPVASGSINYKLKLSALKSCPSINQPTERSSGVPVSPTLAGKQEPTKGTVKGVIAQIPANIAQKKISELSDKIEKEVSEEIAKKTSEGATKGTSEKNAIGLFSTAKFSSFGNTFVRVVGNAAIAAGIYFGGKELLKSFGVSPEAANAIALGAAAAYATYTIGVPLLKSLGIISLSGPAALGFAAFAGFVAFFLSYKKVRYDFVEFSCLPWDSVTGGQNCEDCNKGDIPCTEYRCKSLGQACEIVNKGTTEEKCAWVRKDDTTPPVIMPWNDILTLGYKYIPDDKTSPPDRGYKIVPENNVNGCVKPYTPLRFGVTLNELGKCKLDVVNKNNFESMSRYFGGSSTSKYNHSETINIPSPEALKSEEITLKSNGEFTIYTRCQDVNGNFNLNNIVFRFCVDQGPDTSPPVILTTSIPNNSPIGHNVTSVNVTLGLNEPAECRWSTLDQSYENMENEMSCSESVFNFNNRQAYPCIANLTGIKDRQDNTFYFRCLDQPHLKGTENETRRNVNKQSYKYVLVGTRPLVISSIKPNNTIIKDSTNVVKVNLEVETFAGYKNGEALCFYSDTGEAGTFVQFFSTGGNKHLQELRLVQGDYTFYVNCIDLGGNIDSEQVNFRVESDKEPPVIIRVFSEQNNLKIITNEKASCVYSTSNRIACTYNIEDATNMTTRDKIEHSTLWDPNKNFYIKCKDEFGNEPPVNQCTLIARSFEFK